VQNRRWLLAVMTLLVACQANMDAPERPVIERKDDLPRHSYQLSIPVVELYQPHNKTVLLQLATKLRADVERDLASYDIRDATTLQGFYGDLASVAVLEGRWQDYLDLLDQRRALETKEANRLTMALVGEAFARAEIAGAEDVHQFVGNYLQQRLAALPYELVQDNLKRTKGSSEILSRALVLGSLESRVQPVLDNTQGEMSFDIASRLVNTAFTLDYFVPAAGIINTAYSETISANQAQKVNIWADREVALAANDKATPAVISVWDSGVDISLFNHPSQLWTNPGEIPDNGLDDDGNGFVDDIHGIGWSLHSDKEAGLLFPISEFPRDEAHLQSQMKGLGDIQSSVDSPQASALRKELAALQQDQVQGFMESLNIYGNYSHGTHVAGIALQDNPFARLLVARMTFSWTTIPEEPTLEQAHRDVTALVETIDYFKSNGVRAVNMSWGGSLRSIESALEAHNAGGDTAQRKALAREIYSIGDTAFRRAIQGASDILFITSAGNSDNDVTFEEFYPSGYDYPNILSVGAVDEEGNETSFTSLGKVDVYANGFEVESFVPGGNRIKFNGTSMASPQVLNLAGKLLALQPELSTAGLRALILDGADSKQLDDRQIRLLNPKSSLALLQQE
jgi:subtilisin family serine protease